MAQCYSCGAELLLPNPKTGLTPNCTQCNAEIGAVTKKCLDCGHEFYPQDIPGGWDGTTCPNSECGTNQAPGHPEYIEMGSKSGFAVGSFSRETYTQPAQ